jgi:hypothetical protein
MNLADLVVALTRVNHH